MPRPVYYSPYPPPPPGGPTYMSGPSYQQPEISRRSPTPDTPPFQPTQQTAATSSSPQKRRPGCPRKNGTTPAAVKGAKGKAAAAKTAKAKADKKKQARRDDESEKENEPDNDNKSQTQSHAPSASIDISDAGSESGDDGDDSGRKQWSAIERSLFSRWLLGPEPDAEHRFEQHKENPAHIYKKASMQLFAGKRTAKSVGSMWQRALEIFGYILAFESFTGNGGGDPDSDDPTAILKKKLNGGRRAGLAIGTLKV
ncbi:hypothetical protein R3P38DRAFT_2787380 [Favolaschia claudopus]|uniref:Uncharacterized protein n=1 Tax=Favolaschia claudopus TaxID=2862362 RepID=A0AAW0ANR8_9AGAR